MNTVVIVTIADVVVPVIVAISIVVIVVPLRPGIQKSLACSERGPSW